MFELTYNIYFGGTYEEKWTNDYVLSVVYSERKTVEAVLENGTWKPAGGDKELAELLESTDCPSMTRMYFEAAAEVANAVHFCKENMLHWADIREVSSFSANPMIAPELMRVLMDECGLGFDDAFGAVVSCCPDCRGIGLSSSDLMPLQPRTAHVLSLLRQCTAKNTSACHDSALEIYRKPFGAVKCGEEVELRFDVLSGVVSSADLIIWGYGEEQALSMARDDKGFYIKYGTLLNPCGIYYCFRLNCREGVRYLCPDDSMRYGRLYKVRLRGFILTVYSADFKTPEWFKSAVMYQIFPDRFAFSNDGTAERGIAYHEALGQTPEFHRSTEEPVRWQPRSFEKAYSPDDFYGGTLKGIAGRLSYLQQLGVNCIYLNPIVEAKSNHRYDASDYMNTDPVLGTNEDFTELCKEAESYGIRIILDGVYSHTGADSIYFNLYGHYGAGGACQGSDSSYFPWYSFTKFPEEYKCWWGFRDLPEVDEKNPDWQQFIISGNDSVVKTWLRRGASGWRLDVADELPDEALELIRKAVKEEKPDAPIIGEVWENAVTKESYGVRRTYAMGTSLDSVMNYPLRTEILNFLLGRKNAYEFRDFLISQKSDYPAPLYECLMNLVGSHDMERIVNALSTPVNIKALTREEQLKLVFTSDMLETGKRREKLAAAIQFMLPGVPSIYYGDEQGMTGVNDPFNRMPFKKGDAELHDWYVYLACLRNGHNAMKCGELSLKAVSKDIIEISRFDENENIKAVIDRTNFTVNISVNT